jgi:hypothetical protein
MPEKPLFRFFQFFVFQLLPYILTLGAFLGAYRSKKKWPRRRENVGAAKAPFLPPEEPEVLLALTSALCKTTTPKENHRLCHLLFVD